MKNKAKVIKLSAMLLSTIITVVTVTFAWFVGMDRTDPVIIESGNLRVSATLYYKNEQNEFEEVEESLSLDHVIPGKVYNFKLEITNNGTIDGHLSITIINIKYSDDIMKEKFELSFLNPNDNNQEISKIIDDIDLVVFEKYILSAQSEFEFYFTIKGTEDITSEMAYQKIQLSSFLVKLDQIQG